MKMLINAKEATERSRAAHEVEFHLADADRAIKSTSADGHFSKEMHGSPWDSENSVILNQCIEVLEKHGFVCTPYCDHLLIEWGCRP